MSLVITLKIFIQKLQLKLILLEKHKNLWTEGMSKLTEKVTQQN